MCRFANNQRTVLTLPNEGMLHLMLHEPPHVAKKIAPNFLNFCMLFILRAEHKQNVANPSI